MIKCDFCGKKNLEYYYKIQSDGGWVYRFACSDCINIWNMVWHGYKRKKGNAISIIHNFAHDMFYRKKNIITEKAKKSW